MPEGANKKARLDCLNVTVKYYAARSKPQPEKATDAVTVDEIVERRTSNPLAIIQPEHSIDDYGSRLES